MDTQEEWRGIRNIFMSGAAARTGRLKEKREENIIKQEVVRDY